MFGLQGFKLPVLVGRNVSLSGLRRGCIECPMKTGLIRLGFSEGMFGLHQGLRSHVILGKEGKIVFKGKATISRSFTMNIHNEVIFGNMFFSNTGFLLSVSEKTIFGDNTLLGWNVTMIDGDGHKVIFDGQQCNRPSAIKLGNRCWIGADCTILKGVILADDTIVPSKSIITKSNVKPHTVYGSQNKILKENVTWEY